MRAHACPDQRSKRQRAPGIFDCSRSSWLFAINSLFGPVSILSVFSVYVKPRPCFSLLFICTPGVCEALRCWCDVVAILATFHSHILVSLGYDLVCIANPRARVPGADR